METHFVSHETQKRWHDHTNWFPIRTLHLNSTIFAQGGQIFAHALICFCPWQTKKFTKSCPNALSSDFVLFWDPISCGTFLLGKILFSNENLVQILRINKEANLQFSDILTTRGENSNVAASGGSQQFLSTENAPHKHQNTKNKDSICNKMDK